jgi:hypothetical protein
VYPTGWIPHLGALCALSDHVPSLSSRLAQSEPESGASETCAIRAQIRGLRETNAVRAESGASERLRSTWQATSRALDGRSLDLSVRAAVIRLAEDLEYDDEYDDAFDDLGGGGGDAGGLADVLGAEKPSSFSRVSLVPRVFLGFGCWWHRPTFPDAKSERLSHLFL